MIKALIDALANADLSELEYSAGGETLRLVKAGAPRTSAPPPPAPAMPQAASAHSVNAHSVNAHSVNAHSVNAQTVNAPLYGVVHLHRAPDQPPLIAAGDAVVAGQVLCLIEAMKIFTELRADCAGVLEAVLVTTGQEVEAGQPLFRLA